MALEERYRSITDEVMEWFRNGPEPLSAIAEVSGLSQATLKPRTKNPWPNVPAETVAKLAKAKDILTRKRKRELARAAKT